MKNSKNREQAIDFIVKEFNLLPFQEHIIREIWENKSYLAPVRACGWSGTMALLMMVDVLLREEKYVTRSNQTFRKSSKKIHDTT